MRLDTRSEDRDSCRAPSALANEAGDRRGGLHHCGQADAVRPDWTSHGDPRQPLSRIVSYSQWRIIAAAAATRPANAMSSPVISMSSPVISVARQRNRATVRIRARMRDFGLVMPSTMVHHYRATVE
jgi:hypothetical protein